MPRRQDKVFDDAFRLVKDGSERAPLDVRFTLAALTADRVITMPDADVDLGAIGDVTFAAIQAALNNQALNLGTFGTLSAYSVSLRNASRVFSPASFPLDGGTILASAQRAWDIRDLAANGTAFIETSSNIYNGHRVIAVGFGILTTFSGGGVARLDIGTAADPDAFTPTQVSVIAAGNYDVDPVAFSIDPFIIGTGPLRVSFYEADGTTPAEPTAGQIRVAVFSEDYGASVFF